MGQKATLQAFDAMAAGGFVSAGLGDAATYTPPGGGSAVDCTVLVDREQQEFGDGGEPISGQRVRVTLFLAQVDRPEQNGLVALVDTGETWKLYREIMRDENRVQWTVRA